MARPNSEYPTELELQILKVLWDVEPMTVRDVRDALAAGGRDLAHTTVITILGTMVDKGQIENLEPTQDKAFRFSPLILRDDVSRGMLGELVERVFDGSAEAVMLSLFDVKQLDGGSGHRPSQGTSKNENTMEQIMPFHFYSLLATPLIMKHR